MFEELSINGKFAQLGIKNGTDKIETHKYHHFYPRYLEMYRGVKDFALLEIGILFYQSINTWLEYLPDCHVYGTDIIQKKSYGNFTSLICDQSKIEDLKSVAEFIKNKKHKVYFILDDGIHIPEYQIFSFNYFFKELLEPGGCYIIEDIETSYWKRGQLLHHTCAYGYKHNKSVVENFKNLVDEINSLYLSEKEREEQSLLTENFNQEVKKQISSITFCQNCIIILKKTEEEMKRERDDYRYKDNL